MGISNEKITIEFEVFKTGTHTDSEGDTQEWSSDDIQNIVKTYNERLTADPGAEAPIVKGHPETDDPAYGWVKSLKVDGDKIVAMAELSPEFADEVKNELYKKVSIALYPDMMLRHIGFLGAAQPAVKGLEPVKFGNADKGYKTIFFTEASPAKIVKPNVKNTKFEDVPAGTTIETVKAAQLERSKLYGISPKDGIGYIEKPSVYSALTDDQFADPVNYLYPINDKANWISSWKLFDNWESRDTYKLIEKQVIMARFYTAGEALKIPFEEAKIYFSEFTIALNDKLKRDKPAIYSEYAIDDFGDPVHFRFPLKSKSDVKASIAIWSRDNVYSQYSESEQQYIASRLIRAAQNNGMNLTPGTWAYVEIPAEKLTKNQLLDMVKQTENKNLFTNSGVMTMDEYIKALSAFLVQKLSEAANQELATQLQAWVDEYVAQNPMTPSGDAGTPPAAEGMTASEPQIPAAFAERMAKLEKENRGMKFNDYVSGLMRDNARVTPAMKDSLLNLLEATYDKNYEFSENGKTKSTNVQDMLKQFINLMPKNVEFSEQATGERYAGKQKNTGVILPDSMIVDTDREELHNKTLKYMEEQKKLGVIIDYVNALNHICNNQ